MTTQDEFQREERRVILSLGLVAIIVSILINSNSLGLSRILLIWLYGIASVWVLYAIEMMIYFSDDLFSLRIRLNAKEIGLRLYFIFPLEISILALVVGIGQLNPSSIILIPSVFVPFFLVNLLFTPRIRRAIHRRSE